MSLSHDITTSLRSPCLQVVTKGKRRYSDYDAPEKPDNHRLHDMRVSIPNLGHTLDLHSPSPPKAYPYTPEAEPLKALKPESCKLYGQSGHQVHQADRDEHEDGCKKGKKFRLGHDPGVGSRFQGIGV